MMAGVNEDKPDASQMPAEIFTALEQGTAAMIEMFHAYRRSGASLVEAAFIIGAMIVCGGKADD